MTQKIRYKAIVDGVQYTIISSETKESLDMVTQIVDEQFCTLKQKFQAASGEQIAILLAINAVNDQLKKQLKNITLIKESESLKTQLLTAQKEINSLEVKLKRANSAEKEVRKLLEKVKENQPKIKEEQFVAEVEIANQKAKKRILGKNSKNE
jgi:cell division protein ZapA